MNSIGEEVSFYKRILEAIRTYCIRTGGHEPSVIIVHPKTWYDLVEELVIMGSEFHRSRQKLKGFQFDGHPVYRSDDVPEGDFVIY